MNVIPIPTGCPKCNGALWDNRVGKKNPKAPDWKCKNKACDGVVWPIKDAVYADQIVQHVASTMPAKAPTIAQAEYSDPIAYGEPLPGRSNGPGKPMVAPGSTRGDKAWTEPYFHIYADCWIEAGQYSTQADVQASIAATMFIQLCKARPQ